MSKRSKKSNSKPKGFQEFEALAKNILESEKTSYYEWLHEKHQEIILDFSLSNKNQIADLATREGE